ncbi:MAG: hypothetical protein DRP52_01105 [Planctomycetota bacterium]|nr:MAG: hypothetical protein DRP52_01105 [Planctomycetota bacterium]
MILQDNKAGEAIKILATRSNPDEIEALGVDPDPLELWLAAQQFDPESPVKPVKGRYQHKAWKRKIGQRKR